MVAASIGLPVFMSSRTLATANSGVSSAQSEQGLDLSRCLFHDTACSSTVAAWVLALATAAAFIAAFFAARYAWRTFILETKVQLGQSQCLKHDRIGADVVRYLPFNGQLTKEQPAGFNPEQYHRHEHALTALGRASIISAKVHVAFLFKNNEEHYGSSIELGHIQPHTETHVRIYTHPEHGNPFIVWRNAEYDGGLLPLKNAFFPSKPSNGRVVKEVKDLFEEALRDSAKKSRRARPDPPENH